MKFLVFLLIALSSFLNPISAEPFFGIPSTNSFSLPPCSTVNKFTPEFAISEDPGRNPLKYSKTRVTFYGDSRGDLANYAPVGTDPITYYLPLLTNSRYPGYKFSYGMFYGMASMDFYLGINDDSWNVQNFAQSGINSQQLLDYLDFCLTRPDHKIASNVAFEIGGNDYIHGIAFLIFMPWETDNYVTRTMNNIERIVTRFYHRRKNVLVIGNYPTISYSMIHGIPEDGGFAFKGLNFDYVARLQGLGISHWEKFQKSFSSVTDLLTKITVGTVQNLFSSDSICAGGPPGIAGIYFCWLQTNFKAPTSMVSFAMFAQEQRYNEMIDRRKSYFATNQLTLDYVSPWSAFQSLETFEPYVVNHNLMGDLIHPNASGFGVWGNIVSSKIETLGWKTIPTPPAMPVTPPSAPTDDGGEVITNPPAAPDPLTLLLLCYLAGICH